jgi:hypothetical protein
VAEYAGARNDVLLETSILAGAVPLESILCTEELHRRPSRPPDHEKENRSLVKLVSALADSPGNILQTLAETILDITQCDSAGLSLLTLDGKRRTFAARGFIGQLSPVYGIRTWEVGPHAISALAETCSIKIVPCCSDISNGATPICCRSFRQP